MVVGTGGEQAEHRDSAAAWHFQKDPRRLPVPASSLSRMRGIAQAQLRATRSSCCNGQIAGTLSSVNAESL